MKKLALVCGILVSVVSVGSAMSWEEIERAVGDCLNGDKNVCQALINIGFKSAEECKDDCTLIGAVYLVAERYREAIPYYEKAIALGSEGVGYAGLAEIYDGLQDYYNAKKYYEMACNKANGDAVQAESCYNLGLMYSKGKGVRQDYHKEAELYKKACDMKYGGACNNLGVLYYKGQGVRQNLSTAKQYYGRACDFGEQTGCDNYRELNNLGVQ